MAKQNGRNMPARLGTPRPDLNLEGKTFKGREVILAVDDAAYDTVYVPEWETDVLFKALSVGERDRWERLATGNLSEEDRKLFGGMKLTASHVRAAVVQMCALNPETFQRMFSVADIAGLSKKNSAAVTRIFDGIIKLSKVTEEDVADVEAAFEGNPSSGPSTD